MSMQCQCKLDNALTPDVSIHDTEAEAVFSFWCKCKG